MAATNDAFQKRVDAVLAFIEKEQFNGEKLLKTNSEQLKELDKDLWKGVRHKTFLKSIIAASTEETAGAEDGKEDEKYGVNLIQ